MSEVISLSVTIYSILGILCGFISSGYIPTCTRLDIFEDCHEDFWNYMYR